MEKGYPGQESAPPYPGYPMTYGAAVPPPGFQPAPYVGPPPGFQPAPYVGPPPVGYQGGPSTTVTHVAVAPTMQDIPTQAICPHCQQTVVTETQRTPGLMTWAICGGLTLIGCFLCCFIPFCVDSCKDVEHHCPNCRKLIHIYKRL
ncbi:lipopolysaccharide-induced tumor necrosis factor-alpha factor homolog [Vanacampus margaritifer]